ncbi:hypothetical protein JAAARDRAFT_57461 [Jaapia argillacea MUCL 33604]|uniref:Fungal lipase-type domain-containing protein n=1 Tax=Jaapia argillacea MUCL 33604 TaxID=933084 RepID=A0A067PUN6_9AGAM|nr:hypothetical protein JAAARDRAFT_57461 [Jaapia argillacea MUCL 33604]
MYPVPLLLTLALVVRVLSHPFAQDKLQAPDYPGVPPAFFNDLVWYFKYATSAYSFFCLYPNGKTLVRLFNDPITDTNGFVARDDTRKEIVVAFRGTWSAVDIATDANVLLTDFVTFGLHPPAGTKVHAGFLFAWNTVALDVITSVERQVSHHPGYSIVTSGHSMGGSLASLAAVTLQANLPGIPIRLYTYGQPRTGNEEFAMFVNDRLGFNSSRIVHTSDGVPTIIPVDLGYRHHGVEYWQRPDPASASTTRRCDADGEDPTCSTMNPSRGLNVAHDFYFGIPAVTPFCI